MNTNKPLTWDELADIYYQHTGRQARTLPMDKVFDWAEGQPKMFRVDKEGHLFRVKAKSQEAR